MGRQSRETDSIVYRHIGDKGDSIAMILSGVFHCIMTK